MDTLNTLGKKIRTAHDLLSVVKTMKSLAAVNIRQYEAAAEAMERYCEIIDTGWQAFFRNQPARSGPKKISGGVCLILGSDQGMCGQFNEAIVEYALAEIRGWSSGNDAAVYWSAGEKVRLGLEDSVEVSHHFSLPSSTTGIADLMFHILENLVEFQDSNRTDAFFLFHNQPGRAGTYLQAGQQVLPITKAWSESRRRTPWPTRCFPMLGTDQTTLFDHLFRQHIFSSIYKAFAQSLAAENAARLTAMQAAEKNILELEEDLQGRFRETRQNTITAELLDIISGFESVGAG